MYWNYYETMPNIYVQKQNDINYKIIVKNNKTKDTYETIFNTQSINSDIIDFNDSTDFEKMLHYGLIQKQFENVKCKTLIHESTPNDIILSLSLETINKSKLLKNKKDILTIQLTKIENNNIKLNEMPIFTSTSDTYILNYTFNEIYNQYAKISLCLINIMTGKTEHILLARLNIFNHNKSYHNASDINSDYIYVKSDFIHFLDNYLLCDLYNQISLHNKDIKTSKEEEVEEEEEEVEKEEEDEEEYECIKVPSKKNTAKLLNMHEIKGLNDRITSKKKVAAKLLNMREIKELNDRITSTEENNISLDEIRALNNTNDDHIIIENTEIIKHITHIFTHAIYFNLIIEYITSKYNITYIKLLNCDNITQFKILMNCDQSELPYNRDIHLYKINNNVLTHISDDTKKLKFDKEKYIKQKIYEEKYTINKYNKNMKILQIHEDYMLIEYI